MSKLAVPSTSALVSWMVALAVPAVALPAPPASTRVALAAPAVTVGASLAPVMVTVTTWLVPSAAVTVKVSFSVAAAAKPCTVALLLLSV